MKLEQAIKAKEANKAFRVILTYRLDRLVSVKRI